jgi:hypothetical protein
MSEEDLEKFEADMELQLFREYRDVLPMFAYAVETERRFYLANQVDMRTHDDGSGWVELTLRDVWVWDMYRPARFVPEVRVMTMHDINIEELSRRDEPVSPGEPQGA